MRGKEGDLGKLEQLIILVHIVDAANKRRLSQLEVLESLDSKGIQSISQCMQSVLDQLAAILATWGSQVEVMIQDSKGILRILDPWQEFVPLVGTVYCSSTGSR